MASITFVDDADVLIGHGSKQEALDRGIRHRIARVILTNPAGQVLIQRRSLRLLSSPGLWDQSAAGHVDQGETYLSAALRELAEEIGVSGLALREVCRYPSEEQDRGVAMKRYTALFHGVHDGAVRPNADEVEAVAWTDPADLRQRLQGRPADFTDGCLCCFREAAKHGLLQL